MNVAAEPTERLDAALAAVREAVRREHPYHVGSAPDVEAKLNQNESPFDLPESLKRDLLERFLAIPFNRYSAEQPEALKAALAHKLGVGADQVIVGNGSNELTASLGLTFIEQGTAVVLPRPMFALYEKTVHLYGGRVVGIAPRADLTFDAEAILDAVVRERPALTVLTTPNNPTGLEMTPGEIEAIAQAAPGVVLVDEAYSEFSDQPSALALLERLPNVVVMRTFSKAMGLAGLRVGYLVAHPRLAAEIVKPRLPFMVDRLAEQTALLLLEHENLVAERAAFLKAEAQQLYQELRARPGVEAVPTAANFLLFRTAAGPAELVAALAAQGVLVRSMAGYPELPRFVRVSAGTRVENRQFLAALDCVLTTMGN